MTDIEIKAAIALQNCTFLPGSFDKKFVHQLGNWYSRPMTQKGRAMMVKMLMKYRRQIPNYEKMREAIIKETAARMVETFSSDQPAGLAGDPPSL